MRITDDIAVAAPVEAVWAIIADPERVLSYMSGVTRWEVAGDLRAGLGARYRMLFRIGVGGGRRPDRGRRVLRAVRVRLDLDHRTRPARPVATAGSPRRAHASRAPARLRHRRRRHQRLARRAHRRAERVRARAPDCATAGPAGRARAAAGAGGAPASRRARQLGALRAARAAATRARAGRGALRHLPRGPPTCIDLPIAAATYDPVR